VCTVRVRVCTVRLSLFLETSVPECCQTHKVKTLMNKKNVTTQANDFGNRLTIKDLPVELAELSDEALSQVCGGSNVKSHVIFPWTIVGGWGIGPEDEVNVGIKYLYLGAPPDPAIDP